jgi:Tfp pilus assembly protein PilX
MKPRNPNPLHLGRSERGISLIIALMSTLLLTALGLGLVMITMTEAMISANFRDGGEAVYAADAGVERAMQDLLTVPDWNRILSGALQSSFIDGAPSGTRTLGDGSLLDLSAATNMMNCAKATTCSEADMNTWTLERPYSVNNPRWQLYAYSPLTEIIDTGTVVSPMYVVVWIADDPAEADDDPLTDTAADGSPGAGVIMMRAKAFGPNGSEAMIEVTLARTDTTELERGYTGQRGQDEQNRRARKAAVQTPGKALGRSEADVTVGGFASQ